jgi:hypothetical protein
MKTITPGGLWVATIVAVGCLFLLAPVKQAAAAPSVTGGGNEGVTNDWFDVNMGATIDDVTPTYYSPSNFLGGDSGELEATHSVFLDDTALAVDYFNFHTAVPVALTGYSLYAFEDDADGGSEFWRSFSNLTLYVSADAGFTNLFVISSAAVAVPYALQYGTNWITIQDSFAAVTGQYYRVEIMRSFYEAGTGPRIVELDAVAAPVVAIPEPEVGLMVFVSALALLLHRRRYRCDS